MTRPPQMAQFPPGHNAVASDPRHADELADHASFGAGVSTASAASSVISPASYGAGTSTAAFDRPANFWAHETLSPATAFLLTVASRPPYKRNFSVANNHGTLHSLASSTYHVHGVPASRAGDLPAADLPSSPFAT